MGANNSSLTPLNCILKNWDRFDPQGLKKTHLVFLCDTAWPWCPLEDGEQWPVGGSLKYNTVLQLDQFCREQGRRDQSHFVRCILEGLRQARSKPLNYAKLAIIEQKEKEAPGKFLDRWREALRRYTEIDPESEEGKVILKDRFLTQSAPDILLKLSKLAYGPNKSLDNLLQLAQTVYYGREYEEKKERQRKTKEKVEAFTMAMKTVLKQTEKNAQRDPGEKG